MTVPPLSPATIAATDQATARAHADAGALVEYWRVLTSGRIPLKLRMRLLERYADGETVAWNGDDGEDDDD